MSHPNQKQVSEFITTPDALAHFLPVPVDEMKQVIRQYPLRISSYFLNLIRSPGDPLWRQVVPDISELNDSGGYEDPLAEESLSPVPNLVHRYPDRVLWLVSHQCAVLCRFCTRKRRWSKPVPFIEEHFQAGLDYIRKRSQIRDVLLSGGDPLMAPFSQLERILASLREIPHVEIIRIGTRIPVVSPRRITPRWVRMLSRYHPLYMNLHFNHPLEITPESRQACELLANAGIPLGSQTVLLKGVNDRTEILRDLFRNLLRIRVRPYYLLQMDLTRGTEHFRTPLATGLKIIRALRNHISGPAVPHFVVDLPGGQGKVPLVPNYVEEILPDRLIFRNFRGNRCEYPLLPDEGKELSEQFSESTFIPEGIRL